MTNPSFFFYDLETSGFNPKTARVMQFAGQRTDMDLKPIGEPISTFIKMTPDVLPDPEAIMVTGISPQMTLANGISEAEFLKLFHEQIATPGTIFVGFNNIRFDDEFIRYMHYRNFYDPYEWHWHKDKGRWDLLDVIRMTRALRPDGLKWPFRPDGAASNKLELLTTVNKITHDQAHEALSDVNATIAIAQLIKNKQPKLFDYLLKHRTKATVAEVVYANQPFVYTSGKYPNEYEKTTVVAALAEHPKKKDAALVFDLRHNPEAYAKMTPAQAAEAWKYKNDESAVMLPVKTLQFNRAPAVAPLSVLDAESQKRLQIDLSEITKNFEKLKDLPDLAKTVAEAVKILDAARQSVLITDEQIVDGRLYDGFFNDSDKNQMAKVRSSSPAELKDLKIEFADSRLKALLTLYKARNYPESLNEADKLIWHEFRVSKLFKGGEPNLLKQYQKRIDDVRKWPNLKKPQKELLKALEQWAETVNPSRVSV